MIMNKLLRLGYRALFRAPSRQRAARHNGFALLDPAVKIEEENTLAFRKRLFYPVDIRKAFKDRYQLFCKLGYGKNFTLVMP